MAEKLTYFGTPVSPNQVVSKQGYLICLNVPICRTGSQRYLGRELEGHPGYDPAWGLDPNTYYDVYRELEEVTDLATVASFEGVTVVDEHPSDRKYPGSLVTAENDAELNRGHAQNVRVGAPLESGEIPLLADLHVKNISLIYKIDGGIREVSCGYLFALKRLPDGRLAMTRIRGNHVAVVPKGRAGDEVAIIDHDPQTEHKEKKPVKSKRNHLIGLGLMAMASAKDADPEEVAEAAKEATKDEGEPEPKKEAVVPPATEEKKPEPAVDKKAAKDRKAVKDAEIKHASDCPCAACDEKKDDEDEDADEDEDDDDVPAAADADKVEELEDGKAAIATDGEGNDLEIDKTGKSILDSGRELIRTLKPLMGSGKMPKAAVDAYNAQVRALNDARRNPYAVMVAVQKPVLGLDHAKNTPEVNPRSFFEGVPYAEGVARMQAHQASQKK